MAANLNRHVLSGPSKSSHPEEMQVLVLGLCRTGTFSMRTALQKLGYSSVYHMTDAVGNDSGDPEKWNALFKQKYEGDGQNPITREQFDEILGNYTALSDMPAVCFAPELMAAYPNAKVILTTRSTESWYKSMISTIYESQLDPFLPFLKPFLPADPSQIIKLVDIIFAAYFMSDFLRFGKGCFVRHNDLVRTLAKAEVGEGKKGRFLEFEAKQGWGPLCEFLGKEVPEEAYPRTNDTASFNETFNLARNRLIWARIKKAFVVLSPITVAAWYLYGK